MVVKKYQLNEQTNLFEWVQDFSVTDDKAYVEMVMDAPVEIPIEQPERNAPFMYEAGKMAGDKFYIEFTWQSENGELFN